MNLQQFRYAIEIYKSQSINKAATNLFISQPALSQSIKELENDLGFAIFERSNKGVSPTPEGYTFLNSIEGFVETVENLQQNLSSEIDRPLVFRISSSRYTFVSSAILRLYNDQFKMRNSYTISLREVDCSHVIQDVSMGHSDVGILHIIESNLDHGLYELEKKGLAYALITKSRSYVTFRQGHPLADQEAITIADIASYPQVRISTDNADPYDKRTCFNYLKYGNSHRNIMADNRSQTYAFVTNTDAVAYGVTQLEISVFHPNLITRPVADDNTHYYIYAVHQKSAPPSEPLTTFISHLQEYGKMEGCG